MLSATQLLVILALLETHPKCPPSVLRGIRDALDEVRATQPVEDQEAE